MHWPRPFLALPLLALASFACGDDGGAADTEHDHTSSGTSDPTLPPTTTPPSTTDDPATTTGEDTTRGGGSSSGGDTEADSTGATGDLDVTLQFGAMVGAEPAACGQTYAGVGAMASDIEIRDLRFYVSEIRLVDTNGDEAEVALEQDGLWQYENVALLDFEDGTGACAEQTTTETHTSVRGTVPAGDYVGVHFTVGVPFELNHLDVDAATTEPPLNVPGMFWVWAAGHKFMRIDIATDLEPPANVWNFHLGAQGCDAPSPMDPPDAECTRPARVDVRLPSGFAPDRDTIVLDLEALYDGVDLTADTMDSPPGCMSFMPDADECDDLFPNLGLDWTTGACADDCSGQTVFSIQ